MPGRSLNKVMLIGNLTRDPEIRYTAKNSAVAKFGLATNRSWMSQESGQREEQVEFHNITAWGKLADLCGQLLHKGDNVYLEGRLQTSKYQTKDGQDRSSTDIILEEMILLKSRSGAPMAAEDAMADDAGAEKPKAAPRKKAAAKEAEPAPSDDVAAVEDVSDDIPF